MRSVKPSVSLLVIAAIFAAWMTIAAIRLGSHTGPAAVNIALLGLGISLGPCLAAYALAPLKRKQTARRLVLITGGATILVFSFLASANIDLEGFFLLLFEGVAGAAIGHTMATLVLGPLFFGRFLCGWGCWRSMVLELLPVGRGAGRRSGIWRRGPPIGVAIAFAAAAAAYFVFGHHAGGAPGSPHSAGTMALLVSAGAYYAASIGLACVLDDQRAFCKYLCPSAAVLRITSRASMLAMRGDRGRCNGCGACTKVCPMDIDVQAYAAAGRRIAGGECILCQRCANVCPRDALAAEFRLPRGA